MKKDRLFLLKPGFRDPAQPAQVFYCPGCAEIAGLLGFYPLLLERLEVHYIDYPRPRLELAPLLGEAIRRIHEDESVSSLFA